MPAAQSEADAAYSNLLATLPVVPTDADRIKPAYSPEPNADALTAQAKSKRVSPSSSMSLKRLSAWHSRTNFGGLSGERRSVLVPIGPGHNVWLTKVRAPNLNQQRLSALLASVLLRPPRHTPMSSLRRFLLQPLELCGRWCGACFGRGVKMREQVNRLAVTRALN